MVESESFSFAGRRHGLLPERNEDVVLERNCGTHQAAVLCDGAGGCANGKEAARLAAEAAAGFLAFRFDRCLLDDQTVLRREMVHLITEVLTEAAQKAGADPASFGCTMMAAAMDRQGRWCLFHLGDGAVLGKPYSGSDWMIVSYPQRGLVPGSTTLTMNGAMFENLRFCRSDHPSFGTLFLASDGMLELLRSVPRLLERPELGYALLDMENVLEDDCSAAWLLHVPEL